MIAEKLSVVPQATAKRGGANSDGTAKTQLLPTVAQSFSASHDGEGTIYVFSWHTGFRGIDMASWLENGFITRPSPYSVDETVERLKRTLDAKGITLFALVDHSREAAKAVLRMRPTKLLLFGNPKAGTPVMLAAPSSAIDLPLKVLIAENGEGQVLVSYNDPGYLQHRHAIPPELLTKISVVEQLVAQALSYSG